MTARSSFDAWEWLARLPNESRVLGSGPRPGCLHVANVQSGGHSGRVTHRDHRSGRQSLPGAGLQDPVLLDSERRQLSPQLADGGSPTWSKDWTTFTRLLARLRGKLTLSFCSP